MDVVLDSNIFASDFRMRTPRFLGLFDYLRKTRSMLLIPDIVYEEVFATYRRKLKDEISSLTRCVAELEGKLLSEKPFVLTNKKLFRDTDKWMEEQCGLLRDRLDTPAKKVHGHRFANNSDIDLKEVYMRGIGRIPPADNRGEELRDVILWLIVLEIAKARKQISFITGDSGFWDKTEIRPKLRQDMEAAGAEIFMYRSIEQFVKDNAPAPIEASPEWVKEHKIDIMQESVFADSLLEEMFSAVDRAVPNWAVHTYLISEPAPVKVVLYRTGEHQQFAELTYSSVSSGTIQTRAETPALWGEAFSAKGHPPATGTAADLRKLAEPSRPSVDYETKVEVVVTAYLEDEKVTGVELESARVVDMEFPGKK